MKPISHEHVPLARHVPFPEQSLGQGVLVESEQSFPEKVSTQEQTPFGKHVPLPEQLFGHLFLSIRKTHKRTTVRMMTKTTNVIIYMVITLKQISLFSSN